MIRLTFTAFLSLILCGCASDSDQIQIVKSSKIEDWHPHTIENQISLWDCSQIDWDVVQKRNDYSVVSANCQGRNTTSEKDKPGLQACVKSKNSNMDCQSLTGATHRIQFRFVVHQGKQLGKVALLDVRDLHVIKDSIVFERHLSRSEVQRGPAQFKTM